MLVEVRKYLTWDVAKREGMTTREFNWWHYYDYLLSLDSTWDDILTVAAANRLIDEMEDRIPHHQLPPCYDRLVEYRNKIKAIV